MPALPYGSRGYYIIWCIFDKRSLVIFSGVFLIKKSLISIFHSILNSGDTNYCVVIQNFSWYWYYLLYFYNKTSVDALVYLIQEVWRSWFRYWYCCRVDLSFAGCICKRHITEITFFVMQYLLSVLCNEHAVMRAFKEIIGYSHSCVQSS